MRKTKIEYCDMTFAPWYGCTKAGPGCANCYAATWARRFGICGWGDEQPRVESNKWDEMVEANMLLKCNGCGRVATVKRHKIGGICDRCNGVYDMLTVFVNMCDPFDAVVPGAMRDKLWYLIEQTQNLRWLLLTKRPENIGIMVPNEWRRVHPANVWLGVSAEDDEHARKRIPVLLTSWSAHLWVSCEPLLGPIDLREYITGPGTVLDWVVMGAETGPGHRECDLAWMMRIADDCRRAKVPYFIKQANKKTTLNGDDWAKGRTKEQIAVGLFEVLRKEGLWARQLPWQIGAHAVPRGLLV